MNYYEQFYDDLEFDDSEDDPYRAPYYGHHRRDSPPHRYGHGYEDEYRHPLSRESRGSGHNFREEDDVDEDWSREKGHEENWSRGRGHEEIWSRGRGHEEIWSRGRGHEEIWSRGRGHARGSGQNYQEWRGRGQRGRTRSEARGRSRDRGDRGRGNRGRGERGRGSFGPSRGFVNFVKATVSSNAEQDKKEEEKACGQGTSDGNIRFDYKTYQSQQTEAQKEVDVAMETYVAPFLPAYGYGEGSGFENFGSAPLQGTDDHSSTSVAMTAQPVVTTQQQQQQKQQFVSTVKKAIVSPMMHFVKAQNEFKSTDVAFHEAEGKTKVTGEIDQAQSAGGANRAGLGATGAVLTAGQQGSALATFQAGKRGNRNPVFDRKFKVLQDAVKAKNIANKNGIEILHMAVDRVKMRICDEIKCSGRTAAGQPMFECRLEIDGVYIAQAASTAKKRAKHDAYAAAVQMFVDSGELTVIVADLGYLVLVPNSVSVPAPGGTNTAASKTGVIQPTAASNFSASQVSQLTSSNVQTCPQPKIVFHQSSHPLSDKPLAFRQPAPPANPQEMAMKLLNFVKEGEAMSQEESPQQKASESTAIAKIKPEVKTFLPPNKVKSLLSSNKAQESTSAECAQKVEVKQQVKVFPSPKRPQERNFDEPSRNMFPTHNAPYSSHNAPYSNRPQGMKRSYPNVLDSRLAVTQKKVKSQSQDLDDLSQFIIVDDDLIHGDHNQTNLTLLHKSANWNKVILKLEYENCDNGGLLCRLLLADHVLAEVKCMSKDEGKLTVSEEAMNRLKGICYTIVVKQQVDTDQDAVTKDELAGDLARGDNVISDDNVGNKLLRKMGWVGGGCGKDGTGIAEPIKTNVVIGREGLGLSAEKGVGKDFHKKVRDMLQDYIKSEAQHDLHFSSELLKEERATIHKIGQSLGLKTQSKGKNENRFLIVSRRRSANELLDHVMSCGGETNKYKIIPPMNADLASYNPLRPQNLYHGNQ